jgi:hypothetical protein
VVRTKFTNYFSIIIRPVRSRANYWEVKNDVYAINSHHLVLGDHFGCKAFLGMFFFKRGTSPGASGSHFIDSIIDGFNVDNGSYIRDSFFDASDSTITSLPFNTHLFVTISLIGCVILTITSLWGYYKKFRVAAMFCAITSLIAGASAADYLHFTYNRAMAGNVNFDIFRDMVTDVNCTTGMMIIQWDEKETTPISYRCATSRTFGFMGSQPVFIPWPDYQSGTSMKLSQALSMALKEAKMHTESSKSESKKTN